MLRLARTRAESRTTRKSNRRERAQSMVEFALTAPVLIVLLLGLVEMGHAFNSYMTIVAAARDSARMGSQLGSSASAQTTIKNLVVTETTRLENAPIPTSCNASNNPGICITTGTQATTPLVDKWIDVRVCYNHTMIFGVPGVGQGPIKMCSHTKIRIANPAG